MHIVFGVVVIAVEHRAHRWTLFVCGSETNKILFKTLIKID